MRASTTQAIPCTPAGTGELFFIYLLHVATCSTIIVACNLTAMAVRGIGRQTARMIDIY